MNAEEAVHNPEKEFTTLLVFPPQWTPQNPHFAISSIAGHLRKHGYKVLLRDLNVEYYEHVLSPEFLRTTLDKIKVDYTFLSTQVMLKTLMQDQSFEFQLEAMRFMAIDEYFKNIGSLAEKLPSIILDAKETLRDARRFYNPHLLVDAFYTIDKALELISLPYHPSKLSFNGFEHPMSMLVTHSLIENATSPKGNMFYEFMEVAADQLLEEKPDLIGVSINSFSQVLPGLTLAGHLKRKAPAGCVVNIGGNFFSRVKEALMSRPEFFETFCHTLAMGEGEKRTIMFVDELKGGRDLSRVPNILYYDEKDKTVKFSYEDMPEKMENLSFQDFTGLPMELYFTPEIVGCLQSSKGCYWGKCTFCDTDFGIHKDIKPLDRMLEEMRHMKEKFGIRHFEFIDESIHPAYMKQMAQRLIDEKLDVFWFCNGRLEESFNKDMLELLHKSGLSMVLWGYESGNRRINELINKGVDLDRRYDILKNSSDTGIWNFAYIFFGFPTETRDEAMETIDSIIEHKDKIHSYGRSVFTLGRHSLLYLDAQKYGIFDIVEDSEELSTNLHYSSKGGLTDKEIDEMMKICTDKCAEAYEHSLWFYLRYRENIHLYLVKHGKDFVQDFKVEQAFQKHLQTW
ncbi:MAG: radical SAM protein [Firmicutes bacterium]|nr:radical SAM protein [Bacillota bacterium]